MDWKIFSNFNKKNTEENEQNSMSIEEKSKTEDASGNGKKKLEKIYVMPLGGVGEVGKNMNLIQYRDEILVIDSGLNFPDEEMLGIDLVIPDFTYLENNIDKIKGIVITHGHEDHIGGLPYLFDKIPTTIPMYGSKLALALAKFKLDSSHKDVEFDYTEITDRSEINIGKYFDIEFFRVTHSIPDCFGLAIHTPVGILVHSGDFKIDLTPIDNKSMDLYKLAELGEKGVLFLMSDSTNVEREGHTLPEKSVGEALEQAFKDIHGRIIIAAFASHIHRVQQIIDVAHKSGKKIAVDGRSMVKIIDISSRLGYVKVPEGLLIPLKQAESLPEEEVVILCTGTQGEPLSALSRIANGIHKHITIKQGDTVIISATPIPGNEKAVYRNINKLLKSKADVIYEKIEGIHASGHGSREDVKLMLTLIKPKYFMPIHGEYKHLKKHTDVARECGIQEENIIIANNGEKIEITEESIRISGKVPSGITLIDGLGVGDVGNVVLRDRQNLAQGGIVVVVVTIKAGTGKIVSGPDIITRGFVYARESEELLNETLDRIKIGLKECEEKQVTDWTVIKNSIKNSAGKYFYDKTERNPIILPIVTEV